MFGTNKLRKQDVGDGLTLEVKEIFSTIQGEGPFAGTPAIFVRLAGCNLKCYFCDTNFEGGVNRKLSDIMADIDALAYEGKIHHTELVVLTGGEPLRQNIVPLCGELVSRAYQVQIETAGTLWVDLLEGLCAVDEVVLVCSPKTGKVHPKIQRWCRHWKYLIQEGQVSDVDGLPIYSTQVPGMKQNIWRPSEAAGIIWLQPCEAYHVTKTHAPSSEHPLGNPVGPSVQTAYEGEGVCAPDQTVTNSVRDVEQTQRNIKLAASIAMKYNYCISLQLHKLLGLP